MTILLLKATLILAVALALQSTLTKASAAMRHLICAVALAAVVCLPLTLLLHDPIPALQVRFNANAVPAAAVARTMPRFGGTVWWIWLLGASVVILRVLEGYKNMWWIRGQSFTLGLHDQIPVLRANVAVPVAIGVLRPAILMPLGSNTWPEEQRIAALRHEAAHVKRRDLWTNYLAHLACAIYWFHPLAWVLASRLRAEQELACDDAALLCGSAPDLYAEALVSVARFARNTSPVIGCHMINRNTLKNRIAHLIDSTVTRTSSMASLRRAALATATAAVCIGLLSADPQQPAGPDKTGADKPAAAPYRVGQGVSAPRLLDRVQPEYTDEARDGKIEGTVLLRVVIGTDGKAHHINVIRNLDAGLDLKAVEAVQKWTFAPGEKDGIPVDVQAQIEVNFRLM